MIVYKVSIILILGWNLDSGYGAPAYGKQLPFALSTSYNWAGAFFSLKGSEPGRDETFQGQDETRPKIKKS